MDLPSDVLRRIADDLGTAEWARGAGASCRTLHMLQRSPLIVGTSQLRAGTWRSALTYLRRHWQSAQDVSLFLVVGVPNMLLGLLPMHLLPHSEGPLSWTLRSFFQEWGGFHPGYLLSSSWPEL